jgi:hypothetical protein
VKLNEYLSYVFEPVLDKFKLWYVVKKHQKFKFYQAIDWGWESQGYNRIACVNKLLSQFVDPRYLEIGCANNVLFDSVYSNHKIGVDPEKGGTHRTTSDQFFSANQNNFDVVFIDGLHEYTQVRRDVQNAIKSLKGQGYIAIHDMLPSDWISANNPRLLRGTWHGDVWKLAFELSTSPEIDFKIVRIDQGVGIIRFKNLNCIEIPFISEIIHQDYEYFYKHFTKLPIINWTEFIIWLSDSFSSNQNSDKHG